MQMIDPCNETRLPRILNSTILDISFFVHLLHSEKEMQSESSFSRQTFTGCVSPTAWFAMVLTGASNHSSTMKGKTETKQKYKMHPNVERQKTRSQNSNERVSAPAQTCVPVNTEAPDHDDAFLFSDVPLTKISWAHSTTLTIKQKLWSLSKRINSRTPHRCTISAT